MTSPDSWNESLRSAQFEQAKRSVQSWCGTNDCGECDVCALQQQLGDEQAISSGRAKRERHYQQQLEGSQQALDRETQKLHTEIERYRQQLEEARLEIREAYAKGYAQAEYNCLREASRER